MNLSTGVARLLGLVEGLVRLVELAPFEEGFAEVEGRESAFRMLEVLDRLAEMAEEEVDNAELEMNLLGRRAAGAFESFAKRIVDIPKRAILGLSLSQPIAEPLHRAGVTIFALDQQGLQINQHRVSHRVPSNRSRLMKKLEYR